MSAETVQAIYQAFARGDVATILDRLDDAVEWETAAPVSDVPFDATAQVKSYSFPNNGHLRQFNAAGKVVKFDHVTDTADRKSVV